MLTIRQLIASAALLSTALLPHAHAATVAGISGIDAFVDDVSAFQGTFYNWQSNPAAPVPITLTTIENDLTDLNEATYVLSTSENAWIEMDFSASNVYNGEGDDLVFFFVGDPAFTFGLDIDGAGPVALQNHVAALTGFTVFDHLNREWNISAALIDLDDYGFGADQELVDSFRVFIGDEHRNNSRPTLSMIGGFHTSVTAVPLPLPVVLFASGLGLLGLVARRKA